MNICYQNKIFPSPIQKHNLSSKRRNGQFGIVSCQNGGRNLSDNKVPSDISIRGLLGLLIRSVDYNDKRGMISLGMGDPTLHSCFQTSSIAEEAVHNTLSSYNFNGYSPPPGLPQTRKAIAEYLSNDLPYKLSAEDVYVTAGCTASIEAAFSVLRKEGANILLPRPGFPHYDLCASFRNIEVRHYDLLPENGWDVDLNSVQSLIDHNTVGIVIINPGNPCGNVYTYDHLNKIAEVAARHKIVVISDEVYGHLVFGENPFIQMGVFGEIVPVLTLGSISKRWLVPGWRLGWFVTTDLTGKFKNPKVVERLDKYFEVIGGPATFIQAAVPSIIKTTEKVFFKSTISTLKEASNICWDMMKEIPCISCSNKPDGSMVFMVKLNLSKLKDIRDDVDFCFKLAKEESVILLPGFVVGLKNWIRITFAVEPSRLEEALERIKSFSERHSYYNVIEDTKDLSTTVPIA